MTTLEAVDDIIENSGGGGATELDSRGADGRSPAGIAQRYLERESIRIQSRGWHFNRRVNVDLKRDADNFLVLPAGTITADTDRDDADLDVSQVGRRLYDRANNTFKFDAGVVTEQIVLFKFECVPEPLARYICTAATEKFCARWSSPENAKRLLPGIRFQLVRDETAAKRWDASLSDLNVLDTTEARRARGGRTDVDAGSPFR